MKIYTRLDYIWDGHQYKLDTFDAFEYTGTVELLCGATSAQNNVQAQQATAYQQMTQQASQVFGNASSVFNQLQSTFAPTVAAGPSQQGFSAGEVSDLNSQAITQNGRAYTNAKEAAGEAEAAQGGGNNAALQSGTNAGVNANIAVSSANNTANELGQITENNYATGRQNYQAAVQGLAGADQAFNPATSAGSAATGAGAASASTANQIATQNNSWMQAVSGALGGVAGSLVSGGLGSLMGSGGSSPASGGFTGEGVADSLSGGNWMTAGSAAAPSVNVSSMGSSVPTF